MSVCVSGFFYWTDSGDSGIEDDRIFIVNKRSQVKVGNTQSVLNSYKSVIDSIDMHFPRLAVEENR